MIYRMVLEAFGDPDYRENPYQYIVLPKEITSRSIDWLIEQAMEWIDKNNIGCGNWKTNEIWLNDEKGTGENHETLVGYMSYNGRIWSEICRR